MPIPFRDNDEIEELGAAGYLKIETSSAPSGYRGALFAINARGEPIEFSYNRIETPHTFLWRQGDIARYATRKLVASLFSICPISPRLIFCLAGEVGSEIFNEDVVVSLPICRIAPALDAVPHASAEAKQTVDLVESVNAFWSPGRPAEGSAEARLFMKLAESGLPTEPFERVSVGLNEVFGPGDHPPT